MKSKTKNNHPLLEKKKTNNPHKESKCVLVIKPKALVPTHGSGCCLGRPPSFSSGLTAEQPQPPGAGPWGCENDWPLALLLI